MTRGERAKIAMSPTEVTEFLATGRTLALATIGIDGWPHVTAMWYALVDDAVAFMTYRGSQKHRNLMRDNRIVGLVEAGDEYDQLRGVQFRGRAIEVNGGDERLALSAAVTGRYLQPLPSDLSERIARRVVYRAQIASHASWDHRKLISRIG